MSNGVWAEPDEEEEARFLAFHQRAMEIVRRAPGHPQVREIKLTVSPAYRELSIRSSVMMAGVVSMRWDTFLYTKECQADEPVIVLARG